MSIKIKPLRKFTTGTPSTSDMVEGELAVNTADKKVFMRDNANNIVEVGASSELFTGGATTNIDINGRVTADEFKFKDSNTLLVSTVYTGTSSGSYFTADEIQEILSITPNNNSENYTILGTITLSSGSSAAAQTLNIHVSVRSNTLPDLAFTQTYNEELTVNNDTYITPILFTKETSTASVKLCFKVTKQIFGVVSANLVIIPRIAADLDNVSVNTTVASEFTGTPTGFTERAFTRTFQINAGSYGLQNSNATKIEATSTGATVTGTLVSDGLTINTNELVTDANGNVGIGTTSPQQKLHIAYSNTNTTLNNNVGDGNNLTSGLRVNNTSSTSNTYASIDLRANSADVRLASVNKGTNTSDFVVLVDKAGNTSLEEALRITSEGNMNLTSSADGGPVLSLISNDHGDASNFSTEGSIRFLADNDADQSTEFARIYLSTADVADGSEDGWIYYQQKYQGTIYNTVAFGSQGSIYLLSDATNNPVIEWNATGGTNFDVQLRTANPTADRTITLPDATGTLLINSGNQTLTGDLTFPDDEKAVFGTGSDLTISHESSGNHSVIRESGTGNLYIDASNLYLRSRTFETFAQFTADGSAELYHNNSKKFETTSAGITVTGTTTTGSLLANASIGNTQSAKGVHAGLSSSGDPQLALVGDNSNVAPQIDFSHDVNIDADIRLILQDTGNRLALQSHNGSSFENMARFISDGAVELYHDNNKKIETTSTGVTVTGSVTATTFSGTASNVTVSDSSANTNFPVVFHDESNGLLDDTGALRYNPSTGTLLAPNLVVAGTTTTVNTVTMEAANAIVFEGATADANETTLTITDPTVDRTITLPNATGQVVLSSGTIDSDAIAEIGKAHIGYMGWDDLAGFSHVDQNGQTTYSLLQASTGKTYLNSASGQTTELRIGNSSSANIDSTGLTIPSGKKITTPSIVTSGTIELSQTSGVAIKTTGNLASADLTLLRASSDTAQDGQYGFDIKYMGSRTGNANSFALEMHNQNSTNVEAITVYQDGKVGINQTTPTAPLHVGGTSIFDDDVTLTGANGNIVFDKSDDALEFADNVKLSIGDAGELEILNNGTNSVIRDVGPGNLSLQSNGAELNFWDGSNGQYMGRFTPGGSAELYHNGSKKFETSSTGATVTGSLTATSSLIAGGTTISDANNFATIEMQGTTGAHIDLKVGSVDYTGRIHANSSSMDFIHDVVKLKSNTGGETYLSGTLNGAVELYYDNVLKHFTKSSGTRTMGSNASQANILTYGPSSSPTVFTVKVVSTNQYHPYNGDGSSNKYSIDGEIGAAVELHGADAATNNTEYYYRFDQSDSSNSGHPLRFYLTADRTTEYTTGVTTNGTPGSSGAYTQIAVTRNTPKTLYYQCSAHAYMGNYVTVVNSTKFSEDITVSGDISAEHGNFSEELIVDMGHIGTYTKPAQFLVNDMNTGDNAQFTFGKRLANDELVEFGYYHAGTNSDSNILSLGFYGSSVRYAQNPIGQVAIGGSLSGGGYFNEILNVNGNIWTNGSIVFEGSTADANETTLTITDPTADRTITLPNATGTVITTGNADTPTTTSEVSHADHVLINDGGVLKKITPSNLGIGSGGGGSTAADDITAGDAAVNLTTTSGNITIDAQGSDTDIIFKGTDGSTDVTFLTFDGSVDTAIFETATTNFKPNATASFAAQITDSSVGVFRDLYLSKPAGAGDVRLIFFESGGNSLIIDHTNPASDQTITLPGVTGTVLTTGNSDTPTTTTSSSDADHVLINDGGVMKKITPANLGIGGGGGGGSTAADDITTGDAEVEISTTSGQITINNAHSDSDIVFNGNDGGSAITALRLDMSDAGTAIFNHDVKLGDNSQIIFGAGSDFSILHDGTRTIMNDSGTGELQVRTSQFRIRNPGNTETLAKFVQDGEVELFHDGNSKFVTTSTGVTVTGLLTATTKSFDIKHPTKEHMRLRYGVLEGPEHGVYVRGKLISSNVIELPEHWTGLVDEDTITVQLTPTGKFQKLYVKEINNNKITIGNSSFFSNNTECFYIVQGTRKDVDELEIEYEN